MIFHIKMLNYRVSFFFSRKMHLDINCPPIFICEVPLWPNSSVLSIIPQFCPANLRFASVCRSLGLCFDRLSYLSLVINKSWPADYLFFPHFLSIYRTLLHCYNNATNPFTTRWFLSERGGREKAGDCGKKPRKALWNTLHTKLSLTWQWIMGHPVCVIRFIFTWSLPIILLVGLGGHNHQLLVIHTTYKNCFFLAKKKT